MESEKSAYEEQIVELELLLSQAKNSEVQSMLRNLMKDLQVKLAQPEGAASSQASPPRSASPPRAPTIQQEEIMLDEPPEPHPTRLKPAPHPSEGPTRFVPVEQFAWDQGEYNSEWVTVYVTLPGVGTVKDHVSCNFGERSFDLTVLNKAGVNYRLIKDNLDKDIDPAKSTFRVKKDKVIIKLHKIKGEYGSYDNWTNLTAKRPKKAGAAGGKDPMGGIMDLMKDMYDEGDDNMKKIIGESMMNSRAGIKNEPPPAPSFDSLKGGMGSMGGLGGFGKGLGDFDDLDNL